MCFSVVKKCLSVSPAAPFTLSSADYVPTGNALSISMHSVGPIASSGDAECGVHIASSGNAQGRNPIASSGDAQGSVTPASSGSSGDAQCGVPIASSGDAQGSVTPFLQGRTDTTAEALTVLMSNKLPS